MSKAEEYRRRAEESERIAAIASLESTGNPSDPRAAKLLVSPETALPPLGTMDAHDP
jgi:5-enolpyruvylshikimate-3-phosphate synthase